MICKCCGTGFKNLPHLGRSAPQVPTVELYCPYLRGLIRAVASATNGSSGQ